MDQPDFRALCAELLAAIQLYTGLNPAASEMSSVEKTEKLMDAIAATAAALATPPPELPTDEEILELMPEEMRAEFSNTAKLYSTAMHGQVKPGIFRVVLNTMALEYARAVLERWGK